MSKIIGYILALVGIGGVVTATVPQVGNLVKLPAQITSQYLIIGSIAVAIIGIFLIVKGGKPKIKEVPIFAGKNVVGFRRMKKGNLQLSIFCK